MSSGVNKLFIGTNLKMYKDICQTTMYLQGLAELTRDIARDEMCLFVIPSFLSLPVATQCGGDSIQIGAQNMFWEDSGQFTGEVSPLMLKEVGIRLIEIGHSERRQHFGETDLSVNKKVLAGLKHGFTTLVCVGETGEERELGVAVERIRQQVKIAFHGTSREDAARTWVAYEPVWAIGVNGIPAKAEYANEIHRVIRDVIMEIFQENGQKVPVLYGGSVNMGNAEELICQPEIDGLFIGRAAWEADEFNKLIRKVLPLWRQKTGL